MTPRGSHSVAKATAPIEAVTKPFTTITKVRPEKPIPKAIRDSNKRLAVSGKMNRDTFRILDLPDELRLKIYGFILPSKERIYLDFENYYRPLPYIRESFGSTANLLRVSKKIQHEASEYIYSNNIVNIIKPGKAGDCLAKLGSLACQFINKLECHISRDLGDLGGFWKTMNNCHKLGELRLVFYHDHHNWNHVAGQIAYYVMKKEENKLIFELELYDSIWANGWLRYGGKTYLSLNDAAHHASVYPFKLPEQLKKVTVTASIDPGVTNSLLKSNDGQHWQHEKTGFQQNGEINTLRFIGTDAGDDIDLQYPDSD